MPRAPLAPAALLAALLLAPGCGGTEAPPQAGPPDPALSADPAAAQALQEAMSRAINEATIRYKPLSYRYDEDLLEKLDQIEAHLARDDAVPAPRFLAGDDKSPGLDEAEERDHFRETIRLWRAASGKDLRAEIDRLKADVAARKPGGPTYHPDFHRRFAAAFDDLMKIEVEEMRQRRNRALHEAAKVEFDKYRPTHPDLVRHFEALLDDPQYRASAPAAPAGGGRPPGPDEARL